jgi:hypothetical protein
MRFDYSKSLVPCQLFHLSVLQSFAGTASDTFAIPSFPRRRSAERTQDQLNRTEKMPREHVHAIAHLHARPDKTEELNSLLASLLEPTCQESRCIRFELVLNRESPTEFAIVSEWYSERASKITWEPAMPSER